MKDIINIFKEYVWPYRHRTIGLISMLMLWLISCLLMMPFLRDHYNFFRNYFKESFAGIYLMGSLVIILYAYIINKKPSFKNKEIGIIFALTNKNKASNKAIEDLYYALKQATKQSLNEFNFRFKRILAENAPDTFKDAYKLREDANATLLIWGNLETGNQEGNLISIFDPVYFTFLRPKGAKVSETNPYAVYEDEFLKKEKWQIRNTDDIEDLKRITKSIDVFSRYLIAYCFMIKKAYWESLDILKRLKNEQHNLLNLKSKLTALKDINFGFLVIDLNLSYKDKNNQQKIKKAENILSEMNKFEKDNPNALLLESTLVFLNRADIEGAKNIIVKAMRLFPIHEPAPNYSMAFLQFYDGKIEYGWNHLKVILGKMPHSRINKIVQFYEEALEEKPEKKILHFPLGVLYFKELYGMEDIAREHIKKFIEFYKFSGKKWEKDIQGICDEIMKS